MSRGLRTTATSEPERMTAVVSEGMTVLVLVDFAEVRLFEDMSADGFQVQRSCISDSGKDEVDSIYAVYISS